MLNYGNLRRKQKKDNNEFPRHIPHFVIDAGEKLYSLSIKLYGSAFAVCAGFMASVYPYMFVSDCKYMYSAKGAMHTIVSYFSFYLLGLIVLIMINFWGTITNFVIALLSVICRRKFIAKNWKRHYFNPYDKSSIFIRSFFYLSGLALWLFGTALAIRFINVELTVPDILRGVNEAAKLCPPSSTP